MPDIEVVNQDGRHVRFNSQVVEGRIAIVTGFFTNCSSMCPFTQEKLAQVAKLLGTRMGKDVVIVSVSVDAENDTPARMKDWGREISHWPRLDSAERQSRRGGHAAEVAGIYLLSCGNGINQP